MNSTSTAPLVACLLTGPTRAAVATVAIAGPQVGELLAGVFRSASPAAVQPGQVRYGSWHGGEASEAAAESVVVSRNPDRDEPQTRESWEIHCHGGVVAAGRILEDLRRLGAVVLSGDQWRRWQGEPLLLREAHEVLSRTTSVRTAAIALDQVRGAMWQWVERALRRLDEAEDGAVARIAAEAADCLRFSGVGLHLDQPWRVVLAGPPNVGKSSLINALLGYRRSITLDQPGTTRDVLEAQTVIEGWPVRLSDTAGIRDAAECEIETAGIELARGELGSADLVLWIRDAARCDEAEALPIPQGTATRRVVEVHNKIDLLADPVAATTELATTGAIATAATSDVGIESLRQRIAALLVPATPPPGQPVPFHPRHVACLQQVVAARDERSARAALEALAGANLDVSSEG